MKIKNKCYRNGKKKRHFKKKEKLKLTLVFDSAMFLNQSVTNEQHRENLLKFTKYFIKEIKHENQ